MNIYTERKTHLLYPQVVIDEAQSYGSDILIERGYNPALEAERARVLIDTLGETGSKIARYEQTNNRTSYRREFLEDHPLSYPRKYWHYNGKLHSYPLQHELTLIEGGINPGERDGMTLEGFQKYQEMIANSSAKEGVFLWYSPAGPGGSTPPFDELNFESGRLYICFKTSSGESVHFDVKIQEGEDVQFQVAKFYQHVVGFYSDDVFDYLREPVFCGSIEDFFASIESFNQNDNNAQSPLLYVSRRDSMEKKAHSTQEVFGEIKSALNYSLDSAETYGTGRVEEEGLVDSKLIDRSYRDEIWMYADAHGLSEVTLYGCSTTNLGLPINPRENIYSSYSTLSRFTPTTPPPNEDYSDSNYKSGEKTVCCTCPFCKKKVMAKVRGGKIHCESKKKGGCGKSAPYKDK